MTFLVGIIKATRELKNSVFTGPASLVSLVKSSQRDNQFHNSGRLTTFQRCLLHPGTFVLGRFCIRIERSMIYYIEKAENDYLEENL